MAPKNSPPTRSRFPYLNSLHLRIAAILILSLPPILYFTLTYQPPLKMTYGEFIRRLERGEVKSAKLGTSSITGELKSLANEKGNRRGTSTISTPFKNERFQTSRIGLEEDQELFRLLKEKLGDDFDGEAAPGAIETIIVPMVSMSLMILAFLYIVRRSGGIGSAMAFAKSRPRVYEQDDRRVTFEDVAGNIEAVTELQEVVDFLRTPERFQALGGRIPKGVLLAGPPGTGKTLLAKAVAGEAGVPFFSLSGSDFVEMFVGVGAARVRSLFLQAEAKAPCLIFIDELDAIGKARGQGSGQHDERDQTLNQLLVQMDGFDANRGIILIAATNRPEILDPALVRPGRFDRQVVVDRPDISGREDILKVHVKTVALDDQINLRQIAAMTSGFVGADLANLVNEAALLAARKGKSKVGSLEFQEGVERVIAGPEKRQRVLLHEEKLRIAFHEAGHALVSRSLPQTDSVHKVTILGRGSAALGYTLYRPEDDRFLHTKTWLESSICSLLGGTVAEEIIFGEASDGATSDLQRATQIARKMVTDFGMSPKLGPVSYQTDGRSPFLSGGGANDYQYSPRTAREIDLEVRRILEQSRKAARLILERRREALEAIGNALMEQETIEAFELAQILSPFPYQIRSVSTLHHNPCHA